METINRLGLYNTIFANHRDETVADTSTWSRAFNSLPLLLDESLSDKGEAFQSLCKSLREVLIREDNDIYYCWVLAALSPWGVFPVPEPKTKGGKPPSTLPAAVAYDSLRFDNKTLNLLNSSVRRYQNIVDVKTSIEEGSMEGSEADIRQHVGQAIRHWGQEWRLCVVNAMLSDIMKTNDAEKGTYLTLKTLLNLANYTYKIKYSKATTNSSHTSATKTSRR